MDDYRRNVKRALGNYLIRQEKKEKGPQRRNQKPEKEVEKQCLEWMRSHNWDVSIYESKATYDPKRGVYRQQSINAGHPDCAGVDDKGYAVYVEFKAPGKLSTYASPYNQRQQLFIEKKINAFAFACVTDSPERLAEIYARWLELKPDHEKAIQYLHSMLPRPKTKRPGGFLGE